MDKKGHGSMMVNQKNVITFAIAILAKISSSQQAVFEKPSVVFFIRWVATRESK
jgi:hypothetical protein